MYKTVLADPLWPERGAGKIKRGADRHYALMTINEILEYMKTVPYADDCHLYIWTTNNYLVAALRIIEQLGFRYITNIVWVKDKFGLGQYFRGKHELLLFSRKGKTLPYRSKAEDTIIFAPRKKHSQKPEKQYQKIEAVSYPPYLELFARKKRKG